jgi:hypothetical protein
MVQLPQRWAAQAQNVVMRHIVFSRLTAAMTISARRHGRLISVARLVLDARFAASRLDSTG